MKRVLSSVVVAVLMVGCGNTSEDQGSTVNSLDDEFDPSVYRRSNTNSYLGEHGEVAGSKEPVLIYYAVDSEEPFMQTAVDYELRGLREVCVKENRNINWVAFLNSHYVYRNKKYLLCKNGILRERTLTAEMDRLIATISDPEFDPEKPSDGVSIPLSHKQKYNKLFKKYPLAHPEVLARILEYTENNLFDADSYTFFIHLKSHGSDELLLSGLTEEKLETKVERQRTVFDEYMDGVREEARLSTRDIDWRNRVACEAKGALWKETACFCESREIYINQFYGACERKIGRAGLGTVGTGELGLEHMGLGRTPYLYATAEAMGSPGMGSPGMGSPGMGSPGMGSPGMGSPGMGSPGMGSPGMGSPGMGSPGMGSPGMGFEDVGVAGGLGVSGMGAENYFGATHESMVAVLERTEAKRMDIGFIVFESCESNVQRNRVLRRALEDDLKHVHGYYSANGSLWYRNIDWHHILYWASQETSERRSERVAKILDTWTKKIPTWVERDESAGEESEDK